MFDVPCSARAVEEYDLRQSSSDLLSLHLAKWATLMVSALSAVLVLTASRSGVHWFTSSMLTLLGVVICLGLPMSLTMFARY